MSVYHYRYSISSWMSQLLISFSLFVPSLHAVTQSSHSNCRNIVSSAQNPVAVSLPSRSVNSNLFNK